jgi:hypothetical protein
VFLEHQRLTTGTDFFHVFGMWNVRSMYKAGLLRPVAEEIPKHKLNLVGVHVRWDEGGNKPASDYILF